MMPVYHCLINNKYIMKAGIVVMLAIFLFFFVITTASADASVPAFGNIDSGEDINVNDVVLAMRYVLDLETLDADQRERADVNNNGVINVQDVSLIMQRVLELIDEFPVEKVATDTFFEVEPGHDSISGVNWPADKEVTVSFADVEIVVNTDAEGSFEIHRWQYEELEFEIDQTVMVSDGVTTKVHIVRNLQVTGVDAEADLVFGAAPAGSSVEVRIFDMEQDYEDFPIRTVVADGTGQWTADFSEEVANNLPGSAFNIVEDVVGEARITDLTGDATHRYWTYGEAAFSVYPDELITGFNWAPKEKVTITVGGSNYEAETDSHGYFSAGVKANAGDTVVVTDGIATKKHVVTALEVTEVDRDNGIITGTAEAGTTVFIELLQPMVGQPGPPTLIDEAEVKADLDGNWTVNFAMEIEESIDLVVMQEDDDGDRTVVLK